MRQNKKNHFFRVYPKGLFLIPCFSLLLFLQVVSAAQMLVPVGKTVGVTMNTNGLLVLGTGSVEGEFFPCKGILQEGDLLLSAEGTPLENKEMLMELVEKSEGKSLSLELKREGRMETVAVTPVFSRADNAYKIGAWIRDSIQGIGTVTYYDPATQTFGALGHGVYDVDTDSLMEICSGALVPVELTEIIKGRKGKAGELMGTIDSSRKLAEISENTEAGIFGQGEVVFFGKETVPLAEEVQKGKAAFLSDLEGQGVKAYDIQIEAIRKNGGKDHKDMTIRITDERLLKLSGGIVQGVSGSPILQNGKLVGAVTHVLLGDPTRGYGIFIGNMLEETG